MTTRRDEVERIIRDGFAQTVDRDGKLPHSGPVVRGPSPVPAMRIFTCDNFSGHYPVGVAAVMVAANEHAAMLMLVDHLQSIGLPQSGHDIARIVVKELPLVPCVTIIADGNY